MRQNRGDRNDGQEKEGVSEQTKKNGYLRCTKYVQFVRTADAGEAKTNKNVGRQKAIEPKRENGKNCESSVQVSFF